MTDDTVTFIADWAEAREGVCDCCSDPADVLTFNADEGETVVDLCRPCALALAGQADHG